MTSNKGEVTVQEPTRGQRAVARRAAESRATIPHLELTARVEFRERPDAPLTARLVAACAAALRQVPRANASYRDGAFELYSRVNVAVLLATADAFVPTTVFDADRKDLADLDAEIAALARRAQEGSLTAPELSGSTSSVADLSASSIAAGAPVVIPPHAAALAAGGVHPAPTVRDGAIVPGHAMTVTLACDHRILYGHDAAAFLVAVKAALERG